ncbi:MAG: branched-chain amino acid ABC transporter permease, partial [Bacillota bacterium]
MTERRLKMLLTLSLIGVLFLILWWANTHLDEYKLRILRTGAIYIIAAVSYNLVNGITGQFSLGPNGFMALGGYTTALLILPLAQKKFVWFLQPLIWPFNAFSFPAPLFVVAVLLAGVVGAVGAVIVGVPSF